ncbi:S8 family serine peptidase [Streptomyces sp. DSM 42041]|uniref:S8 family serine peptidase n=1 Tax=Streptomyces hazeniae TaxID=3075538 RepID=A0ABU2NS07_9ACTN|nr:S8 family serine peptidase [Streptomyces sp. DSM 42041]MDT0379386.1 S8 family serine peptidase [Streptomyces sp. DSM 42041]
MPSFWIPAPASSGVRRTARLALAAGLVVAIAATSPAAVVAADGDPVPATPAKSADDKLGSQDAELLAEAVADGDKNVTMMLATRPGATEKVAGQLDSVKGGSVGRVDDKLGYVRATVPTGRAEGAIDRAKKLSDVVGIDLLQEIPLPDPAPEADRAKGANNGKRGSQPGPGEDTPADNPYQPAAETGAVDFVEDHPKADGRGVTIGVLDSGVDLGHPALQKTTTGERKIVDWVTATDPIVDGDGTWRPMVTSVSGPTFEYADRTWSAPAGSYQVSRFSESVTTGGDMAGDLNRDGDTTDRWGVLYEPATGTVRVDLDDDGNFGDQKAMKPYKDGFQIGWFGEDDPNTEIAERIPFVVEIRKDVPMDPYGGDWVGKKADFVNIGVVESAHGTHVAGITAANGLFGGEMDGAAPGAKIVSSRACSWSGGCTSVALTEGMIDLVTERGVDIVNMSIGGLPALNDGNNARAELYTRLIDTYDVQLVISAGNSGPGANTIGDPSLADKVLSVGASVSKETWAANYGSRVKTKYDMMPFSSRGPREDGGFTPVIAAPGASVNTVPSWQPGQPVPEAGYDLPPGYGMFQGTSMASPQAAGASALLLSAAKRRGMELSPLSLRTALTSTADTIKGRQAYEQGAGLIDVEDAWKSIRRGATAHAYTVKAPVDTALSGFLKEPGFGSGLYDREGGLAVGERRTYTVDITRTSGPVRPVEHEIDLSNDDGTFRLVGDDEIALPLNEPVSVKLRAKAKRAGIHSAALTLDDERTEGVDKHILATVVAAEDQVTPAYAVQERGSVQRNGTKSYFVTVPEGAKTLEVAMSGLRKNSQTRWVAINPYGLPADPTSTVYCYNNYDNPDNTCRPDLRSYEEPLPGVWEFEVEARRTSPRLNNPFTLTATALGTTFDPAVQTLPEAEVGTPAPVEWEVTNEFGAVDGSLRGGELGSARQERPTISDGESQERTLVIGEGVSRVDVVIGSTSDTGADLDLSVSLDGEVVGSDADGDSEESVTLLSPEAGTYTITVDGYAVPAGSTAFDYRDVYFSSALGEVKVDESRAVALGNGESATVDAEVVVAGEAPEGRTFFGEVQLVNARGTTTGAGSVRIEKVVAP